MTTKPRRWLITGVSSGLGRSLLRAVAARGDHAVGTLRDLSIASELEALAPGRISIVQLDVTDRASADRAVTEAVERLGGIDVLVNNAGAGIFGPVEACSDDDFRRMMEVNYFGLIRLTKAALPQLREQRGIIINIASIAGAVAMPGTAPYSAAKHAVVGVSESLAEELAPLGVKVVVVLPGGFRSDFWSARSVIFREGLPEVYSAYPAGQIPQSIAAHLGHEQGDPEKFPNAIFAVLDSDNPPVHLVLAGDALDYVGAKLDAINGDLNRSRDIAAATAFG